MKLSIWRVRLLYRNILKFLGATLATGFDRIRQVSRDTPLYRVTRFKMTNSQLLAPHF